MADNQLTPVSLDVAGPWGSTRAHFAFDLGSDAQRSMFNSLDQGGLFEPGTTRFLASVLKPGDTFLDIGAHIGYFSVLAASIVGTEGEVIAFEPEPSNFRQLVEHVALNGFTNVLPLHLALGEVEHVAALYVNADNDGGHALWDVRVHADCHKSRATPRVHPVYVARLDRVLGERRFRSLKAIKIDVEGSEVLVLRGAANTLARHRVPFVVAEVNRQGLEQMGTSEGDLRSLMKGLGYECWLLQDKEPELIQLDGDASVKGDYVFNLLFRRLGAVIG